MALSIEEINRRLSLPSLPRHKRAYYRRVVSGRCVACSGKPEPGKRHCVPCGRVNSANAMASARRHGERAMVRAAELEAENERLREMIAALSAGAK